MNIKKIIYNVTFFVLTFFVLSSPAFAATYYVDATNGKDTNTGLSEATAWKTIAKVNASRLNPGDQILFKRGEIWRERLIIPSSGSSDNSIVFGAYGDGNNPIINGADIIKNWTVESESTTKYYSIIPDEPSQVFENGIRMVKCISKENMGLNNWYWDSNNKRIYIRTSGGDYPSGYIIEASQRGSNICINGKDYIIIECLSSKYSNESGINFYGGSNNVIINNCILTFNYRHGIKGWTDTGIEQNVTVSGCDISYNWMCGISLSLNCSYWKIAGNSIHHNAQGNVVDSAGIYLYDISVNNIITEYNSVYSNGLGIDNESGYGIWYDTVGSAGIIRYNSIYGNSKSGIQVEQCTGVEVYYNIVYNNKECQILLSRDIHRCSQQNTCSSG
jgi:parallel beta-helix repeat protein